MTPSLNEDVYREIIQHLSADVDQPWDRPPLRTLTQLALVNKSFLFSVRPLIWGSLSFHFGAYLLPNPADFSSSCFKVVGDVRDRAEVLARSLELGALVKRIEVEVGWGAADTRNLLRGFEEQLELFRSVLRSCVNLQRMSIDAGRWMDTLLGDVATFAPKLASLEVVWADSFWPQPVSFQVLIRLLSQQSQLNELTVVNEKGDYFLEADDIIDPTFGLQKLHLNFSKPASAYATDPFLACFVSTSWDTLRSLTAPLPNKDFFASIPLSTSFTSLNYLHVHRFVNAHVEAESQNEIFEHAAVLLARCPSVKEVILRGPLITFNLLAKEIANAFVESFPFTARSITLNGVPNDASEKHRLLLNF